MHSRLEHDYSYSALLKLPSVGRILLGMQIARVGQSMVAVAIVLFTLIAIGASFGVAAVVIGGSGDPAASGGPPGASISVLDDAWSGLVYTWRNPTLRGLAFSISSINVAGGVLNIVVPVIVLERLHLGETVVGILFAVQGLAGIISAVGLDAWIAGTASVRCSPCLWPPSS